MLPHAAMRASACCYLEILHTVTSRRSCKLHLAGAGSMLHTMPVQERAIVARSLLVKSARYAAPRAWLKGD